MAAIKNNLLYVRMHAAGGMAGDAVGLTPVFFIMAGVAFAAALLACVLKRHDALRLPM
jgi:hypothetical protein